MTFFHPTYRKQEKRKPETDMVETANLTMAIGPAFWEKIFGTPYEPHRFLRYDTK